MSRLSTFALSLLLVSAATAQVGGSGTSGFVPRWTNSNTLGNSVLFQAAGGKIQIGTTTLGAAKLRVFTGFLLGVESQSSSDSGVGVAGRASNKSGTSITTGVRGRAPGPKGLGVEGTGARVGVFAYATTDDFPSNASLPISNAESDFGGGGALVAVSEISGGTAGIFVNRASGNLLVGASGTTPVFRVNGSGKGFFNGGTQTGGADFAESIAVTGDRTHYEPGDLLVIDKDGERRLSLAAEPYSPRVAGIYSTKPGILATTHAIDDPKLRDEIPLAIVGIVPCKVSVENGPVEVGDLLVASSKPGYAMKGTDRARMLGAVVGKAMSSLHSGTGTIEVLVTLQ